MFVIQSAFDLPKFKKRVEDLELGQESGVNVECVQMHALFKVSPNPKRKIELLNLL